MRARKWTAEAIAKWPIEKLAKERQIAVAKACCLEVLLDLATGPVAQRLAFNTTNARLAEQVELECRERKSAAVALEVT